MNQLLYQAMCPHPHKFSNKEKIEFYGVRKNLEYVKQNSFIVKPSASISCSKGGLGFSSKHREAEFVRSMLFKKLTESKHLIIHEKYVISKSNKFKKIFDKFMILLNAYSVISSLYYLAFQSANEGALIFDLVIWFLFIIDFSLNFFTEYKNKQKKKVKNLILIAENYAKSYLILDFIPLIPIHFAGQTNAECFLRLLRTFKMGKIFQLFNKVKFINSLSSVIYKNESLAKKKFKQKVVILFQVYEQILKICFFTYFLACIWYYYVELVIRSKDVNDDFISRFNLEGNSKAQVFFKTWYYMFTTLATVGYGDFSATNKYEMGLASLLCLGGCTWFALLMGNAIGLFNAMRDLEGKEENRTRLNLWLCAVEGGYKELSMELKDKVIDHFKYIWKNDRLGSLYNNSLENDFSAKQNSDFYFSSLPENIQKEVLDYLFSDIFYTFRIFFNSFIEIKYDICQLLQPRLYKKGESLLKPEHEVQEIIFYIQGFVSVIITKYSNDTLCVKKKFTKNDIIGKLKLRKKCIIGEYYVLKNRPCPLIFNADTTVKAFALPSFAFKELANWYPEYINGYLDKVQHIYNELDEFIEETNMKFEKETKEQEQYGLDTKRINTEKEENSEDIRPTIRFAGAAKSTTLGLEIERVDNLINICHDKRKSNFSNIKEKLAELSLVLMELRNSSINNVIL